MEKYEDLLSQLLLRRGLTDENDIDIFLNPNYKRDFHDPFLMKDMERACVRLFEAIDTDEKIIIYADYDCDGIPGAVILHDLFEKIGYKNYDVYIPLRNSEGYGLNMTAIKEFAEKCNAIPYVIGSNGGVDEHENWQENLKFAVKVQEKANELYPGLFKPIILRNSDYNQFVSKAACIIEVGATGNTLEQCLASMKYLSKVIREL